MCELEARVGVVLLLLDGRGRRALDGSDAALAQQRVTVDLPVGLPEGLRAVAAERPGENFDAARVVF